MSGLESIWVGNDSGCNCSGDKAKDIGCKKYGLKNLKICGEKLSSDTSSAEIFINEFISITEGYSKHQIFNCD